MFETVTFADGSCYQVPVKERTQMTEQDIQAWEREINHAAKMQAQRKEVVTFSGGKTYELPVKDDKNDK